MIVLHYYIRLILIGVSIIYLDLWQWGIAILMTYFYVLFGGSIGLHRVFAHGHIVPTWFRWFSGVMATLIGAGSIIQWIALHRHHHKYADTDLDPHSPKRGFINLILLRANPLCKPALPLREMRDPFYQFFHYSYWFWHLLITILLLLFSFDAFLMFYAVPSALTMMWIVFSVYYIVHKDGGYRNFDTNDSSKNIGELIFWTLTAGEALHNNHHANPKNPSFAVKENEFDIGWEVLKRL